MALSAMTVQYEQFISLFMYQTKSCVHLMYGFFASYPSPAKSETRFPSPAAAIVEIPRITPSLRSMYSPCTIGKSGRDGQREIKGGREGGNSHIVLTADVMFIHTLIHFEK